MLNLKKSLKFAGVLAIVLGAAAPAMTTAASAAPAGRYDVQRVAQNDRFDGQRDGRNDRDSRQDSHRYGHGEFMRHGGKHCHHEFRGRHDR